MEKISQGSAVLQKNKGQAAAFPKIYPPFGTAGVVIHRSAYGCTVKWDKSETEQIPYIYPLSDLLYIGKPNKYGYRYDLNVLVVREEYERYKNRTCCPQCFPLSDGQRFEFERQMDNLILVGRYTVEEIFIK